MKLLFFANTGWNLYNFRHHLITTLNEMGHDVHLLCPDDEYIQKLISEGFTWHPFTISRKGMNPIHEYGTIIDLDKILRQIAPDALFNFTPKCVIYGSLTARSCNIPNRINTISGLGYLFSGPRRNFVFLRNLIRLSYAYAMIDSKVIFQNPDDMDEFIQRKIINKHQAFLIRGSGVDITKFHPQNENDGIPIIILPARLIKEKGAYEFEKAAEIIKSRGISARFVLVGKTDLDNPSSIPIEQINRWVEAGILEWWGWRLDMENIYPQASIICLPTFYREGTPKSLIEAAACGRPIIASDIPGCREIVKNNENGLLIPPRNASKLADAIEYLLAKPELCKIMGEKGRSLVENEFNNNDVTEQILRVAGL
jgi:glycosyltransferase involved in cell wall biosynthesis